MKVTSSDVKLLGMGCYDFPTLMWQRFRRKKNCENVSHRTEWNCSQTFDHILPNNRRKWSISWQQFILSWNLVLKTYYPIWVKKTILCHWWWKWVWPVGSLDSSKWPVTWQQFLLLWHMVHKTNYAVWVKTTTWHHQLWKWSWPRNLYITGRGPYFKAVSRIIMSNGKLTKANVR